MEASAQKLTAEFVAMNKAASGVNIDGWSKMQKEVELNSRRFRAAANSTGMWESSLVKVRSATEAYTEAIERQKLSFRDLRKNSKLAQASYHEQLKLQEMVARSLPMKGAGGKSMFDVNVPTEWNRQLDTSANRIGFLREQLRSASTQMINWGKNTQWAGRQLMVGFTLPVAAFGAAASVAAYQVDKELTRIQKVYDTTAQVTTGNAASMAAADKELAGVREASLRTAEKAAKQYGAAATDTLAVQAELAATGLKSARLQEATNQVMRISTLGEMDRQVAMNATISLQSVFRMSNQELADSFNYMNAVENATSLQLKDFATAIPIAAGPIKQFGGDVYELGVLLTAMKERGIDASEGANALKATMQRLSRPSKQIREEFTALSGGFDITKIVDESNSLSEIFTRIGDITKDLDDDSKRKIFAGLFGGWQVTRMSAMVEGMQEVQKGVGQAGKAFEIAQGSAENWADQADREIKRVRESLSGKFMIAWQTLKLQIAEIGEVFLPVATFMVKAISKVVSAFNDLPGPMKILLAFPVGILAIAGPLIMLTGLFANFIGNAGKMFVSLTKVLGEMELLNTESAVAKKAAILAEAGLTSEAAAVNNLTRQFELLTLAMARASGMQPGAATASVGAAAARGLSAETLAAEGLAVNAAGQAYRKKGGSFVSNAELDDLAKKTAVVADKGEDVAKAGMKAKGAWKGVVGNVALAGGAMMMMSGHAEGNTQNMVNMLMTAGLLAPALSPAISGAKSLKNWVAGAATGTASVGKHAAAAVGPLAKMKNLASASAAGVGRMVMGINPWVAGAAAVAGSLVVIRDAMDHAVDQQRKVNNSTKLWAEHLDTVYKGYKRVAGVDSGPGGAEPDTITFREQANQLKESDAFAPVLNAFAERTNDTDRMTFAANQFNDIMQSTGATTQQAREAMRQMFYAATGDLDEMVRLTKMFDKYLADSGSTSKTVQGQVAQLGVAIDDALSDRGNSANNKPYSDYGFSGYWQIPKEALNDIFRDEEGAAEESGRKIAVRLSDGLATIKDPIERGRFFEGFEKQFAKKWDTVSSHLSSSTKETLRKAGIEGGQAFRQAMIDQTHMDNDELVGKYGVQGANAIYASRTDEARQLASTEAGVSKELKNVMGLYGDINSLMGVQSKASATQLGLTRKQARENFKKAKEEERFLYLLNGTVPIYKTLSKEEKLRFLNVQRTAMGLAETNNLADGLRPIVTSGNNAIKDGNGAIDERNGKLRNTLSLMKMISGAAVADAAKNIMSDFQQGMADAELSRFDSQMQNAMDSVQAAGEARMKSFESYAEKAGEALQNRQEAATSAMERRQESESNALERRQESRRERIEKSYDRRIEGVERLIEAEQKAEEKRQRIFEAEQTRLDRMNESQNRNIDFNVALNSGNLDEAAKIRNDMMAATSSWALEDANAAAERRSERRTNKLENRKESIEEARDKELEAIAKVEKAEQESLQRRQAAAQKALQKRQEAEQKSLDNRLEAERDNLQDSIDADQKAAEEKWQARRDFLEKSLDDFTRYIAKDASDLKRHIALWKKEHKGLSDDTRKNFKVSTDKINDYLHDRFMQTRRALVNEGQWSQAGRSIASQMIKGAFGLNLTDFRHWMVTGKYPGPSDKAGSGRGNTNAPGSGIQQGDVAHRHEGGMIGTGGKDSRKGVARNLRGMHPNEVMLKAQRGEFVVNRRAASKHQDILEQINSNKEPMLPNRGTDVTSRNQRKNVGGAGAAIGTLPALTSGAMGFSGLMFAAMLSSMKEAIRNSAKQKGDEAKQKEAAQQAYAGLLGAAAAGTYGGRAYGAEQMKNASIIASVGKSMGMSARDIEIGIMTAITESGLVNIHGGDRDSQGLFQQRPSQGWGTVAQVTNPQYAAHKFFSVLKGVTGRGDMSPWMAAQTVQRSAFSDGRNYHPYWDDAIGIFSHMKANPGGAAGGPLIMGSGGKHRPVPGGSLTQGIHDSYTGYPAVDIGVPVGTPVRAVADGTITRSYDLVGNDGRVSNGGYYSYGRVIYQSVPGGSVLYAHLSQRNARAGQKVKGGTVIGRSGNTGHSFGPHLHFGAHGVSPYAFLKVGGVVKQDGTPAILHKNETVLTEPLSNELHAGIGGLTHLDELAAQQSILANAISEQLDKLAPTDSGDNSGTVRAGSYNVFVGSNNAATAEDLAGLIQKADILSLQEYTDHKRGLNGFWPKHNWNLITTPGGTGQGHSAAIAYNKAKYKATQVGTQKLNSPGGPGSKYEGRSYPSAYVPYARMEGLQSGLGRFWYVAAHTIAHASSLAKAVPIRLEQYKALRNLHDKLAATGLPVLMAGDFNLSGKPAPWFENLIGGKTKTKGLDHIVYDPDSIKQIGSQVINNGMSSDHPAVLGQFKIPGLSEGGFTMREGFARLHEKETVLTAPLSEKLNRGIDKLAAGGTATYNIYMPEGIRDPEQVANYTIRKIERTKHRRASSRRIG